MDASLHIGKEALKFSAAHFTIFSATEAERLHGHNYHVSLDVWGDMGGEGLIIDAGELKRIVQRLCEDLDDYDGMVLTRTVDGLPYTLTITVRYVQPLAPNVYSSSQTFAKEVLVEVESPYLKVGKAGDPLKVPFRRVFTYDKATSL